MFFPVYAHLGDVDHARGVTLPDFSGCFTAVDELDDLPAAIQEAVQAHCYGESLADIPKPFSLAELAAQPEYTGGLWMLAEVDLSRIDTSTVPVPVAQSTHLPQQLDPEVLGPLRGTRVF